MLNVNACPITPKPMIRVRFPLWVWCLIVLVSLVAPLQHFWVYLFPPKGTVATGLHIPDGGIFITAMNMFDSGFRSPYATAQAEYGDTYVGYFAMPFYWLYGLAGFVGNRLGVAPFLWLGVINGFGGFFYLFVVYRFFVTAFPQYATRAFPLYVFGGGIGGIAYVISSWAGLTDHPLFETYFRRFAMYELIEGPVLVPLLHVYRLYYTVPLALGFGSLIAFIRALDLGCPRHRAFSAFLLLVCSFLNQRFGIPFLAIIVLYLLYRPLSFPVKVVYVIHYVLAVLLGTGLGYAMMQMSPRFVENALEGVRQQMWLSPFITAAFFPLLLTVRVIWQQRYSADRHFRFMVFTMVGYLSVFCGLFLVYQAYFGNLWVARDGAVAVAISDIALLGAFAGGVVGIRRVSHSDQPLPERWVILWFLLFFSFAVSAWGRGWFLQFTPQRLMIFLGIPLAVLATIGLERMQNQTMARACFYGVLICGVISAGVGALCFQGVLCHASPAFHFQRCQLMTRADAYVIDQIHEGRVLTTQRFSDVLALRPNVSVLGGMGAIDLSDQPWGKLKVEIDNFFSKETSSEERKRFVQNWVVDYIFCPASDPVPDSLIQDLRGSGWVEVIAEKEGAVLFRVPAAHRHPGTLSDAEGK